MRIKVRTKYIPPSDTHGSQIRVSISQVIPYDHGENDKHRAAAQSVIDAIRSSKTLDDKGDGVFVVRSNK